MKKRNWLGPVLVNGTLLLVVIIWSIPTIGLLVSSFRTRFDIQTTGWWNVFPHREWEMVSTVDPKALGLDPNGVMSVEGVQATFEELRAGVQSPDGATRVTWVGNKRLGTHRSAKARVDHHLEFHARQLQAGPPGQRCRSQESRWHDRDCCPARTCRRPS